MLASKEKGSEMQVLSLSSFHFWTMLKLLRVANGAGTNIFFLL